MKLHFIGASQTVTGSCYLLETDQAKVLIDCGLFQGPKEIRERNYQDFPFHPGSIDFLLLTHAHTDHSGLVPKLTKLGFKGQILATGPTIDLCAVMLPDSGHIQEMEVTRKNRKASRAGKPLLEPIYTSDEAIEAMKFFRPVAFNEKIQITPAIQVRFVDAGHILGSASIEIWVNEHGKAAKLVFSGDIGNTNLPIVNEPSTINDADYIIMESTYGNRLHDHSRSRLELLREVIVDTYQKGGKLIIPSFAIERTQELLFELAQLYEQKTIPEMPIYLDSPLAIAATEVFTKNMFFFDKESKDFFRRTRGVFSLPKLHYTRSTEESTALNTLEGRAIIIAGSGMADAGRIKHHLKHNLWRTEATVIFIGYQAQETLGRRLLDGEKNVRIHGEDIVVRADIRNIPGFSGHADRDGLLRWLQSFRQPPKKVFVTHGELESSLAFAQTVRLETGYDCYVPKWLETIELTSDKQVQLRPDAIADRAILPAVDGNVTPEGVERAYLQLRMLLRELVEVETDRDEYARLMGDFQQIESIIRQALERKT
ncbi:MBL fold metallo-hydrolase RNA specificity domain-containing protein [Heliophilum fasciatum]|uniref:Metallo-beta-lactamase family protein n=1 Tax=Heliophilum fasciatum TaxID=35700 RepID=A0A4R2RG01_9FIRM|nr:MBL fold metallo-hydrolase [Heliophilum fasciatum]MCW2279158.1 metallo-beta-lactamase family protein [Heliophilum fasciatum]TCP61017.1 metallo-beta-lactamase family protein [Heliophilum fasciatum]